jgi:predicted CopG family antitoxin
MAARTIPLDEEAYEILNRRKQPGQSFSQVIKMHFGEPGHGTVADLLRKAESYALSEETLDAIEEQIRSRS